MPDDACDRDDTAADAGSESMFDMECQNISTHIAGIRQSIESDISVTQDEGTTADTRPSPVFRRRAIRDNVKSTAGLQALRAYDGCDQDDEPEDPLPSTAVHVDDIIVGFNSKIIKYVHCTLQFLLANKQFYVMAGV